MPLFRRREPLHERLAREGGLDLGPLPEPSPPGWMETGHPRRPARAASGTRSSPSRREGVDGDRARFVALADDTLVVEEGGDVEPLAIAVEQAATSPRTAPRRPGGAGRSGRSGCRELEVVELAGRSRRRRGDADRRTTASARSRVDGAHDVRLDPGARALGAARGRSYVVQARRLDGTAWEVEAMPL